MNDHCKSSENCICSENNEKRIHELFNDKIVLVFYNVLDDNGVEAWLNDAGELETEKR